jgi:tetratricopeptide (TPR) repeat protein
VATKKRVTKKDLKKPDEFMSLTEQAFLFVAAHMRKVILGAVALVVIVLALLGFRWWGEKKEAEAYQKFSLAIQSYGMAASPGRESGSDPRALVQMFDQVISNYPRTSAGKLSLLYKGNVLLQSGQFDQAIQSYDLFLGKAGKEKLYRSFALEGLGYAYEGRKEYDKASAAYQKVVETGEGSVSADAYLALGRCYEKLKKNKEAVESYRSFLKAAPTSSRANAVMRRISLLDK